MKGDGDEVKEDGDKEELIKRIKRKGDKAKGRRRRMKDKDD